MGSAGAKFVNIVSGAFTPVLAKHSKSFSLIDCISVGVDRMQRNFEPMRKQVEAWQRSELTDVTAKVVIYEAFVEGKLEAPKCEQHARVELTSTLSHLIPPDGTYPPPTSNRLTTKRARGARGEAQSRFGVTRNFLFDFQNCQG